MSTQESLLVAESPSSSSPDASPFTLVQPQAPERTPVSFPLNVDNTMLSAFDSCPQKFFNEFVLKLAARGESPDLHAGGCFAKALEVTRNGVYAQGKKLNEALADAWVAFNEEWGDYEPPDGHQKSREAMFFAVIEYFTEYPPHTDALQPLILHDGRPAVEFTFALPTQVLHPDTGAPILYSGRFDMLGIFNDQLCICDEKTAKQLGPSWIYQWGMRGQFIGYTFAARQYGFDVTHALIRGVGIYRTEPLIRFAQVFEQYPQHVIDRWWLNVHSKLHQMVGHYKSMRDRAQSQQHAHDFWPMSFGDGCTSYGNCMFQGMCRAQDQSAWYSDFSYRSWDPLKKNPTEGSVDVLKHLETVPFNPYDM